MVEELARETRLSLPARTGTTRQRLNRIMAGAALLFSLTAALSLGHVQAIDFAIVHQSNGIAAKSYNLDHAIGYLNREMFSTLWLMALVWYVWFEKQDVVSRAGILSGVAVAFASGMLSRLLQVMLTTHLRPLHDPALRFRVPFGVDPGALNHWSSFPSDHAAVFFGVAMTIFLANGRVGWLAFAIAVVTNAVRVYCGFHYPSDVVGGGALGVLLVTASYPLRNLPSLQRLATPSPRQTPFFYAIAFYLSVAVATLMEDWRDLAEALLHLMHHHQR